MLTLAPAQVAHSDASTETVPTFINKKVSFLSTDSNNKSESRVALKSTEKHVDPPKTAPSPKVVSDSAPAPETPPVAPTVVVEPAPVDPNGCEAQGMHWRADNYACIPNEVPVAQVVADPAPAPAPAPAPTAPNDIMVAAGISAGDYAAVNYIITHESGWNPYAINASSGACGLGQENPCGKSGCTLGDAVCQLQWASNYAASRYGGWQGAYAAWVAQNWW